MEGIKEFLEEKIKDIGQGEESVEGLLKGKSMRCIEIPWVILRFLKAPAIKEGKILDVGTSFFDRAYFKIFFETVISPLEEFYSVDIIPFNYARFSGCVDPALLKSRIKFKEADIRQAPFPDNFFDLIFCISAIEHIGFDEKNNTSSSSSFNRPEKLQGSLPSVDVWDEDFKAMKEIIRILKPGGRMLLTVPFGRGEIISEKDSLGLYASWVQYDQKRLEKLLDASGAKVAGKKIFIYDDNAGWTDKIPTVVPSPQKALACIELIK